MMKTKVVDLKKANRAARVRRGHLRLVDHGHAERPKTRAECEDGERPCPWVTCRYHLMLEVLVNGNVLLPFPELAYDEIPATCALDVAELRGLTLSEVGKLLNITRERVRQIEEHSRWKLKAKAPQLAALLEGN